MLWALPACRVPWHPALGHGERGALATTTSPRRHHLPSPPAAPQTPPAGRHGGSHHPAGPPPEGRAGRHRALPALASPSRPQLPPGLPRPLPVARELHFGPAFPGYSRGRGCPVSPSSQGLAGLPGRPRASLGRYRPLSEESCAGGGAVAVTALLRPPTGAVGLHPIICIVGHCCCPTSSLHLQGIPGNTYGREHDEAHSRVPAAVTGFVQEQFQTQSLAEFGSLAIEAVIEDTLKPMCYTNMVYAVLQMSP